MASAGELFYQKAVLHFQLGQYQDAAENFIMAYGEGESRENILENLYQCFILPNEEEFQRNYRENAKGLCKLAYEQLAIDFIPVSDTRYYLFDKERQEFAGCWDLLESFPEEEEEEEPELATVLVANQWDVRRMLSLLKKKNWRVIYWVMNEEMEKFASFFKLPGMKERLTDRLLLFESDAMLRSYFQTYSNVYLPKQFMTDDNDKYMKMLRGIHEERIHDTSRKRENVLLSICIPTYNRGKIALENVKELLQLNYDSELEIVVSVNGTNGDADYQELMELRDSRLTCFAFEENQGYFSNFLKVLELAHGSFAMLASDQDELIQQNLEHFLKLLYNHMDAAELTTEGYGPNFAGYPTDLIKKGGQAFLFAVDNVYITGKCYNMNMIRQLNALAEVDALKENLFCLHYPQNVLSMYLACHGDTVSSGIRLWNAEKYPESEEEQRRVLSYMWPEERIEQMKGAIGVYLRFTSSYADFFVENRYWKAFYLLRLVYELKQEAYTERYSWKDTCDMLRGEALAFVETIRDRLESCSETRAELEKMYGRFLECREIKEIQGYIGNRAEYEEMIREF